MKQGKESRDQKITNMQQQSNSGQSFDLRPSKMTCIISSVPESGSQSLISRDRGKPGKLRGFHFQYTHIPDTCPSLKWVALNCSWPLQEVFEFCRTHNLYIHLKQKWKTGQCKAKGYDLVLTCKHTHQCIQRPTTDDYLDDRYIHQLLVSISGNVAP